METTKIKTKSFVIVAVSNEPNHFGLYGYILIAQDGEAYQVGRSRGPWHEEWFQNKIVSIPFNGDELNWAGVGCEIPEKLKVAPNPVIEEAWKNAVR